MLANVAGWGDCRIMNKILHSSESVEYGTPQATYDALNSVFGFTLDPCSTDENHKCDNYYTAIDDGLTQDWGGHIVFMNPPYARGVLEKWLKKAYSESRKPRTTVVCLIPARTDTQWFWDYAMKGEVYFIRRRINFNGLKSGAPFPSVISVMSRDRYPKLIADSQFANIAR